MGFLRKYVFANAALKIVALTLSFLLWVTYTSEPPAEESFQVPLEFINVPAQLEISGDVPASVHIRLRGRSFLLRHITPADVSLSMDFKDEKEGSTLLRLTPDMVHAPIGATVVQVSPPEFRVTLVPRRLSAIPAG